MNVRRAVITAATGLLLATGMVAAQPLGMGPGMMGGYGGGYGMGPGMMGGYGANAYAGLHLSAEQRQKIDDIQEQAANTMWQLMGKMHQQGYHMHGFFGPGPLDEQAARTAYESMAATQKAMFEAQLDARKKIDAVLTAEQRDQLRRSWSGG